MLPGSSPITSPFLLHKHARSKGPALRRSYPASSVHLALSDARMVRRPFWRRSRFATPRPSRTFPTDARFPFWHAVLTTPVDRWVLDGYRCGALPRRVLPHRFCLPRSCDGSASTLPLSRPARALHALRPARLLAHHAWTLSRGFDPPRFQDWPPARYRIQPSTIRVVPSPTGNQPLWGTRKIAGVTGTAPRCNSPALGCRRFAPAFLEN